MTMTVTQKADRDAYVIGRGHASGKKSDLTKKKIEKVKSNQMDIGDGGGDKRLGASE